MKNQLFQPEFISNHGYPSEIHEVVTEDGYILEMHRIPHGKHVNSSGKAKNGTRPVAFLQHCLMCSSADWVLAGPEKSLGKYTVNAALMQLLSIFFTYSRFYLG